MNFRSSIIVLKRSANFVTYQQHRCDSPGDFSPSTPTTNSLLRVHPIDSKTQHQQILVVRQPPTFSSACTPHKRCKCVRRRFVLLVVWVMKQICHIFVYVGYTLPASPGLFLSPLARTPRPFLCTISYHRRSVQMLDTSAPFLTRAHAPVSGAGDCVRRLRRSLTTCRCRHRFCRLCSHYLV